MGNSGNSGNHVIDDKTHVDDLSASSSNLKEKLNTSWKFSTLSNEDDKENENYNFKSTTNGTGAANEKKKLIIVDDEDDDDDENYNSTCEDNDDEEVVVVKDKLNLNSILHIDDHVEDDYDGIGYQQANKGYHNLSTSSASGSTGSTTASASPEQPTQERANDTIENLAFSLLNKLTFDTAAVVAAAAELTTTTTTDEMPIATSMLKVPCEPVPPPCTPVSATLATPVDDDAPGQNIIEKLLNGGGVNSNRPQLIIDDVLLMSHEDGRPVAPLVEPEESFNASKIADEPEQNENDALIKKASPGEQQHEQEPIVGNTAFMMLINKIAPHSHLIEHNFEFEVNNANELEQIHDVKLTGSFNNWQQFLPMVRDTKCKTKWHKSLMLAPGDYEYKFVINDQDWRRNENMPFSSNGANNFLNLTKN